MSGLKANLSDLVPVLETVAKGENVSDVDIVFKDITNKGDGYVGSINFIDIKGTKNNEAVRIPVVVKCAPRDKIFRETVPVHGVFTTEHYMYSKVLKQLFDFQESANVPDKFASIPKCFYSSDEELEEMLIFENLRDQGFKLKEVSLHMNDAYLTLLSKEYAKYHGLCYAFRMKNPEQFEKLSVKLENSVLLDLIEESEDSRLKFFRKLVQYLKDIGNDEVSKSLSEYTEIVCPHINKLVQNRDQHSIFSHGDCWGNNFVFKYQDDQNSIPTAVRILDWQCSLYTSPIVDICYFFWGGCHPYLYKDYKKYLRIYHDTFCQYVEQYGVTEMITFEDLLSQMYMGLGYSLNQAMLVFKAMLMDKDEIPDFTAENTDKPMDFFYQDFSRTPEQYAKCATLIEFLHNEGLLQEVVASFQKHLLPNL